MQTGLVHLHSFLRWVIIILLLVSIFKSYTGWKSGRKFTDGDKIKSFANKVIKILPKALHHQHKKCNEERYNERSDERLEDELV